MQEHARGPQSSCQVWWCSDVTRRRGGQKRWVFCLSVCLSVCPSRFWTSEIVRPISPWRRWITEMILIRWIGKVCGSAPVFTFLRMLPIGYTTKCRSPKNVKICPKLCFFGHRKPTQWTHSDEIWPVSVDLGSALTHQIWPLFVKGGRYRSPKNVKICPKLWLLATGSRHSKHIHMKFGL